MQTQKFGKHLIIEIWNIPFNILNDINIIQNTILSACQIGNLTILNKNFHQFQPHGITGLVLLSESHLSIHTWPENGYGAIDIFTCGQNSLPKKALEHIIEKMNIINFQVQEIVRGIPSKNNNVISVQNKKWLTDTTQMTDGISIMLLLKNENYLYEKKTPYQQIHVYQTLNYGKCMTLDGVIQITEKDEMAYQEMITHVPIFSHPKPLNVLVIGGGDGGVVREILKHKYIKSIVMCEIDKEVVRTSQKFFPEISDGLNNQKVNLIFQDAGIFVKEVAKKHEKFDVIIIDSSDPIGPNESLFKPEFYNNLKKILNKDGIICKQGESYWFNKKAAIDGYKFAEKEFNNVKYFTTDVPTYGGSIGLLLMSNVNFNQIRKDKDNINLKYYNYNLHQTCFNLPTFVNKYFL